jgi:hypothetical protein
MKTKAKKRTKRTPVIEPLRVRGGEAATMIGCGLTQLWKLSKQGIFTVVASPQGRGRGKPVFYLVDELKLYAETNDPERVRAFRREHGRK